MIPAGGTITKRVIQTVEQPSLTWRLDPVQKRIVGKLDGLEAIKQAAYKILQTERFKYLIYSANYGSELERLIGSNPLFVNAEISRMLEEALTQDDRISGVENIKTTASGDSLLVEFIVTTTYGNFSMVTEVRQ